MSKIEKISTIFTFFILVFFVSTCKVEALSQALDTITLENALIGNVEEGKYEYDVLLDQDQVTTDIAYKTSLDNYYIFGIGNQVLNVGKVHYISVIDRYGNLSLYTLDVQRNLPCLENVSFAEFDFSFDSKVDTYDINVDYTVKSVTPTITNSSTDITYEILDTLNLHSGKNSIRIKATNTINNYERVYTFNIIRNTNTEIAKTKEKEYIVPETGDYIIELWGAGGNGSFGGYTKGKIHLNANEKLYFYVGEQGMFCTSTTDCIPGYNGGGESGYYKQGGTTGSGATDVRLINGEWNDLESLKSRIMVAGAGGGVPGTNPGHAGGLTGYRQWSTGYSGYGGYGGTQIAGGSAAAKWSGTSGTITPGGFGYGGNGNCSHDNGYGGGGGGGYYGGGGGSGATSGSWGGGGGSSFISGHAGSIAINEDGTPKVTTYSTIENSYHYSGKVFTETKMIDGKGYNWTTAVGSLTSMPNPEGGTYAKGLGHEGNGYARITYHYNHEATGLSSLTISGTNNSLTPTFDPDTFEYNLKLSHKDENIIIDAIPEEEWSYVTGTGEFTVPVGDTDYTISVLNYDGQLVTYIIHVTREASTYKFLDGVKINGIPYEGFSPNTYEYNIELPTNTNYIHLEAIKHMTGQTVSGEGQFEFNENEKTLTLLSKSEDNSENQLYTFHFTRQKTSLLKSVVTSIPLGFTSEKFEYNIEILDSVFSLDFETETYFEGTVVTITGNKYINGDTTITITSHLDGVDDTIYTIHVTKRSDTGDIGQDMGLTKGPIEYIVPYSGYYEIELWGAGYKGGDMGGSGGYTKGKIRLTANEKLYFYVGGQGMQCNPSTDCIPGYNGGGSSSCYNNNCGVSGSGATDVRLVGGDWKNLESLKSRIMVAGAGGGRAQDSPGHAGGLTGYQQYADRYVGYGGYGGSQTAGGRAASKWSGTSGTITPGGFGYGGNGNRSAVNGYGSGGGSGYYGGGGGSGANTGAWGGGGGSSFISGHAGSIAIKEDGTPKVTAYSKIEDSYHTSEKYFTETKMIDGRGYNWTTKIGSLTPMPDPDGGYYENGGGHFGDGRAKIKLLSVLSNNNFLDSITLDDGDVEIDYDPTVEEYTLNLDETHTSLKIKAIAKDKDAKVVGGDETIKLPPGQTIHEIEVTATDDSVRTYKLIINRKGSSNPHPIDIEIENSYAYLCDSKDNYCQYQFKEDTTTYNIQMPFRTLDIAFQVTPRSEYQEVIYRKIKSDGSKEVVSDLRNVTLEPGINSFEIEVISEDDSANIVYTYHIDRDATGNNLLKILEITDPVVSLDFAPYTYEYYVTIPKDVSEYTVNAIAEDPKAKVDIKGNTDLKVGMNDCIITVTAQNGDTRTYIIHAHHEVNVSTLLSDLQVLHNGNPLTLDPTFNSFVGTYQIHVGNEVSEVDIRAILEDSNARVTNDGIHELKSGINVIDVTITAPDGDTNVYEIVIEREKSANNNLTKLEVEGYTLSPEFEKDTLEYSIEIPRDVTSVKVNVELEDSSATYTIRGNNNLDKPTGEIVVTVIAENKEYKIYKIKVTKEISDNNFLKSLTVSEGTLNPNFDQTEDEYTVEVESNVDSIEVTGVAEDKMATVTGNGVYYLTEGENTVTITVTSESGAPKDYVIKVNKKAKDDDLTLKEVTNNRGSKVTEAENASAGYDYLINVQYEVPDIILEGIPNSKTTKVTGNGYYSLNIGNNDITLRVTSEAGNYKDYVVRVVRDLSTNDDLSFLFVEEGGLNPHFNETTIFYNVKVPNNVTEVHIEAIPEDKDATVDIVGDTTNLEVGVPREIQVVVTAPKGNQKTYTLSITRQEMAAENLALLKLETNRGELTPVFNPDTLNYTLEVENEITDITVTAEALSDTVQVLGTGTYDLRVGKNGISVFVVGTDEVQRDYQIVVTRKKSKDATLSSLVVKSHTLSPTFNKTTENYTLTTSGTYLDFTTIKPTESEATYIVSGNENFVTGENTVTIEVTAPDGETKKTYTLTVTKTGSKNNNLSSLEVVGYSIIPNFHKAITFYTVEVANNIHSVVIQATTEDVNATIEGTGFKTIETGENYFDIVVTSEEGTKKTYTILVTKEASDNNYLSSLYTDVGVLDPNFDKETLSYEVTVPYTTNEITIGGSKEDIHAVVTGFNTYPLSEGENNFSVVVTSESGLVKTYTVKVTRETVVSAYLTDLKVKNYELDTEFNKELFEYYITVGNEVTELDLSYTPEDKNATVNVTGNENFEIGMNEVHIEVTSSDGNLTEEYILYVNRQMSSNNFLSSLRVNHGTLNPVFNPNTLEYNVEVESDIDSIVVYATTEDSSATITSLIGDSHPYSLNKGLNKIQVKVRSMMGISRTYIINVTRKESENNDLADLKVYFGPEKRFHDINFNKETKTYTIDLASKEDYVEIEATLEDSNATIIGDGVTLLKAGENIVSVSITSESGSTNVYTITINNPMSDNNYLTKLIPSAGTLDPEFNKETLEYTLKLTNEVSTLSFTVKAEDSKAKVTGHEESGVSDGESVRLITVTAENGDVKTYKVKVQKETESEPRLEKLEILGYPFEFDPDTFEYHVQVSKSKKQLLESEITAIPKDSNATVNLMGDLNLIDGVTNTYIVEVIAKDGYTTQEYKIHITRDSLEYTIRSNVYDINRDGEVEHVIGMDPKTKKVDFLPNFENDPETLHIYGSDGVEITEEDKFIGSYMTIKLEIDGYTYDELVITVRGDLNGDGLVTAADNVQAKSYVLGKKQRTFLVTKIADINKDGLLTAPDVVRIKNYILGKRGLNE